MCKAMNVTGREMGTFAELSIGDKCQPIGSDNVYLVEDKKKIVRGGETKYRFNMRLGKTVHVVYLLPHKTVWIYKA